jgi:hypothetical protein
MNTSFYQLVNNLNRVITQDIPNFKSNEIYGYRFRNSNGEVDATIAQNSNATLAFYSPMDVPEEYTGGLTGDGNFDCIGDVTGFNDSLSDSNFKMNIEPYTDWQSSMDALKPVIFTWKEDAPLLSKRGTDDIGLIAQDVAEAYPLAHDIKELNGQDVEIVKYEKLVPLLIAAIQDLRERVAELESEK